MLHFNTTFHPTTNGPPEPTTQTLEDMQRACILYLKKAWD